MNKPVIPTTKVMTENGPVDLGMHYTKEMLFTISTESVLASANPETTQEINLKMTSWINMSTLSLKLQEQIRKELGLENG